MQSLRSVAFTSLLILCFALVEGFVFPLRQNTGISRKKVFSERNPGFQQSLLFLAEDDLTSVAKDEKKLPMLLDPGTKGGALFLSLVLFVVPIIFYQFVTNVFGVDGIEAGKWIGVGFTFFTTVLWVSTYIFRVATKDMTYAKQLKDYENAVIAKRLEELNEDEIQALVEDIERDEF
jgi:Protein of unknown function (DUF3007)